MHAGHAHEYVVCPASQQVATLCRLLRRTFETNDGRYTDRPRVMIFAPSAEAAVDTASRLQVRVRVRLRLRVRVRVRVRVRAAEAAVDTASRLQVRVRGQP